MVLKTHEIDAICNRAEGTDPRLKLPLWLPEIGGYCTAKYEGTWFRAKILEKLPTGFMVKYMDYGNLSIVPEQDIQQLNPELTLIPRQYLFFKLSNVKPLNNQTNWTSEACQFTQNALDGGIVDLEVESVEHTVVHWGKMRICSTIQQTEPGDFGQLLVKQGLADSQQYFV